MNKILFSTLIFLSTFVFSQELNEDFLESLPESVREDVLEQVKDNQEQEKPLYRRSSSKLDKDDFEEYVDNYFRENDNEINEDDRKIFGSDFFKTFQTSFMPINEPNLDNTYDLDFGDVLEIQLIGQKDSIEEYQVLRDGSINIADIGKLFVSGLSLGDASELIKARVSSSFIGTDAYVSLINVRDIVVLIAGNAFNPGIYTLNGNSNILHALTMAGGISDIGSFRDITLIRNNKVIDTLDIYKVLIDGKSTFATRLRSGDSIVVKTIGKIVSIESGVMRPGSYELKDNETFNDLVRFANGFSSYADKSNIVLNRIDNGLIEVKKIKFSELNSTNLKNGDGLFIKEYKLNTVFLEGAVKNPGKYTLSEGTKLSQLIEYAGGYESSAYPFGGFLDNKKTFETNEIAKEILYNKFLNNLISNSSLLSGSEKSTLPLILKELKDSEVNGRLIAEFDLNIIKDDPTLDTTLNDKDRILIPNITQQVFVQGEVSNPGAIRYSPGKNLEYYITNAGGELKTSDSRTIFIVHPNGETETLNSESRLDFVFANSDKTLVYPGSIIYVPRSSSFASGIEAASIWAPIISSVALSITSLSVLNDR